jgi:uncharacterized radical SAM superfamily Fe-S cluster-containing enzyme
MNLTCTTESLLKRTTSRCPVCHSSVPAEVWKVSDGRGGDSAAPTARVFLRRTCPEHGFAEACIASDARFYWLAQGDPQNQCCGGSCKAAEGDATGTLGRNAIPPEMNHGGRGRRGEHGEEKNEGPAQPSSSSASSAFSESSVVKGPDAIERLSTCLALIEIVNSCNLACPTCYADSPTGALDAVPLADVQRRIQGVLDRKGRIEILQLSGGEPTLHPQFFELLAWLHAHPGIDYVLLNTNGVRIANDDTFLDSLGKTFRAGKFQLYLQFDGVQEAAQRALRGGDLREMRKRAIERCGTLNIPITLAMTVTPENLPHLWDTVEFGLGFEHVRGVSFQPVFGSGRVGKETGDRRQGTEKTRAAGTGPVAGLPPASCPLPPSLNTADVILALVAQSSSRLRYDDFTPLPCGDPNCATIGYLLKIGGVGGTVRSISDFVDFRQVQDFLRDKVRYTPEDLARCGCESEPLGELLHELETGMKGTAAFRLFIKPFMDAWTWDEDRIDRCCTHVIRPDGKLDSFCRYYSGFADAK